MGADSAGTRAQSTFTHQFFTSSIFSTALVITSRCATVVFLCSPTSDARHRAGEQLTGAGAGSDDELERVGELAAINRRECPDDGFGIRPHSVAAGRVLRHDAPRRSTAAVSSSLTTT